MKSLKFNLASVVCAAFSLLVTFSSCKKELPNSCDPKLNNWAITNAKYLQNDTREDLAQYTSIDSEFTAYAILTPTAKCQVWKDKLAIVIRDYGLTEAEKQHVQIAYDHLQPSMFEEADNSLEIWGKEWEAQAKQQFGWDEAKTVLIAETWLTGAEIQHIKEAGKPYVGGGGGAAINCNCYYSVYCSLRGDGTCNDGGCEQKKKCGVFGRSNCTGTCG